MSGGGWVHQGFEPGTEVGGFFAGDVVGAGGASVVDAAPPQ